MTSLFKAIYDRFAGDQASGSVYEAVGGRLYATRAPENAAFPYIVFFLVSGFPEEAFGTRIENARFQFSIFSDEQWDDAESMSILTKLRSRFDFCALNFTALDYANVGMIPDTYAGPLSVDERMMIAQDYILRAQTI